jgi:hypothetical protein
VFSNPGYRSRGPGFDSRRYHVFFEVVGLERDPLSLVSTTEELFERKSSGSGIENREYGRRDSSRWPRGTLYPQKLALTSPTSGGCSVGIVRSRTGGCRRDPDRRMERGRWSPLVGISISLASMAMNGDQRQNDCLVSRRHVASCIKNRLFSVKDCHFQLPHSLLTFSAPVSPHWSLTQRSSGTLALKTLTNQLHEGQRFISYSRSSQNVMKCAVVHYRAHKSPPKVSILSQFNPAHNHSYYFIKLHSWCN